MLCRVSVADPQSTPTSPRLAGTSADAAAAPAVVGWPLWCAVASAFAVELGVHWDIAWHRSIGRDSFWSPPHALIYFAAILAATAALVRIVPATFGAPRARGGGVRVLGFRGPLGAFISAWGGVAMLASAPFDDWWHNAYGLDVKILSPPHTVLALGIVTLQVGALVMLVGAMNRKPAAVRPRMEALVLAVGAMMLVGFMTAFMEKTVRVFMHTGSFYLVVALCAPLLLTTAAAATRARWAATRVAAVYSAFLLAMLWLMPLVPAQPKLGPVLVPTSSLVPPEFPLLILPAAIALDLWLGRRRAGGHGLVTAAGGGVLFLAVFMALQWPFATFLMSPPARNYFWGARYFDFAMPPEFLYRRYLFYLEPPRELWLGLGCAFVGAIVSVWVGLSFGRWLRGIVR
jgi:hypothetical protein